MNHHIVMKYYLPQNLNVNIVVQINPNSTFIQIQMMDDKNTKTLEYIDTGATLCIAQENTIDKALWTKFKKKPLTIRVADKSEHKINYGAFIIQIKIVEKTFIIPSVYKHDT